MLQFPNSENIQLYGLDIILSCLKDDNLHYFVNESCAKILIHAIIINDFKVKWRAFVALMKLSTSLDMCRYIEKSDGCGILLNEIRQWFDGEGIGIQCSLLQLALWTLSNICKHGKMFY